MQRRKKRKGYKREASILMLQVTCRYANTHNRLYLDIK